MTDLIAEQLNNETSLWKRIGHNDPLKDLIIRKGVTYEGRKLPKGITLGKRGVCYMNALRLSLSRPGWKYVEGYGVSGSLIDTMILMNHAWCLDENGLLVDNTWRKPATSLYRGIAMDPEEASEIVYKKGYYGVFLDQITYDMDSIERFDK